MTPAEAAKARQSLADLICGGKVVAIEAPDPQVCEGLFKLMVERNGAQVQVTLCATDLGWWIERTQTQPLAGGRKLFTRMGEVVGLIQAHLDGATFDYLDRDFHGATLLTVVEDESPRRFGFRCAVTDEEWWVSQHTADESPWAQDLQTPEGRAMFAAHLGRYGHAPVRSA